MKTSSPIGYAVFDETNDPIPQLFPTFEKVHCHYFFSAAKKNMVYKFLAHLEKNEWIFNPRIVELVPCSNSLEPIVAYAIIRGKSSVWIVRPGLEKTAEYLRTRAGITDIISLTFREISK